MQGWPSKSGIPGTLPSLSRKICFHLSIEKQSRTKAIDLAQYFDVTGEGTVFMLLQSLVNKGSLVQK